MKRNALDFRGLVFVVITGLILSSCSKKSTPADDLVGTWTEQSSTADAKVGTKPLLQYFTEDLGLTATEAQQAQALFNFSIQQDFAGTIQIKSDHTYTSTLGGQSDAGTWNLSSDNKQLIIDSNTENPFVLDVAKLTSSMMELKGTATISQDLNNDQIPETIIVSVDLNFTK
ncbi:MAG: DUF4923 family protein [Bacteroidota bacterium]|nr:DUF4923 family protein [Bacteroidota bacterium]